tara:strand:- start:5865 stop:6029 length:165 start_codon:yes stop_codon:yes gene_type:complete
LDFIDQVQFGLPQHDRLVFLSVHVTVDGFDDEEEAVGVSSKDGLTGTLIVSSWL